MEKVNTYLKKSITALLTMAIFISSTNISAIALPVYDENMQNENEDSTFVLSSSNVQSGDDEYYPETANPESEYSAINNTNQAKMLTATVGDPMVYLTQKWLNQNYGNVSGFGTVTENGKTGWNVVYGLTRALQHELGITSLRHLQLQNIKTNCLAEQNCQKSLIYLEETERFNIIVQPQIKVVMEK